MFNNGMAMSAVRCDKSWRTRAFNGKQDSMLTAQGQLFRTIAPMVPRDDQQPKCLQTYMFGRDKATMFRMQNMKKSLKGKDKVGYKDIFDKLDVILRGAGNKYLDEFMAVHDYVQKKLEGRIWDVNLSIAANAPKGRSIHRGTINAPSCNEVAILFPEEIVGNMERQVVLNYRTPEGDSSWYTYTDKKTGQKIRRQRTGIKTIPDYHRMYDPIQYPLLFPKGQDGWHMDLDHTCLEHLSFMLMDRFDEYGNEIFNPILRGNQLGEQYIVDQFAKAETGRLRYVELHQKELCCEVYSGLNDAMNKDGGVKNVGKRVILPSSFTGGPRYQQQEYLDSMALFQRFGRPHFFVTMTCNPYWKEIQDQLKKGQTALNRPDIVVRVFKMKLDQLLKDLGNECIFGKLKARTYVIEFQKRGFPHAHILLWLDIGSRHHLEPHEIDQIICAEIPDEFVTFTEQYESLLDGEDGWEVVVKNPIHETVTNNMLHGPCGVQNPTLSCMRDGECRHHFPKEYRWETELSEDGYPQYRRRSPEQGGNTCVKHRGNRKVTFTNADVVCYNKFLLFKYKCHINVEYCHSIKSIKYLFKYCTKGSDKASLQGEGASADEEVVNEVEDFKLCRYVSSGEAAWRARKYPMTDRKPAVNRLQMHLENEQCVFFEPSKDGETIERMEKSQRTKLTSYFELNETDEHARTLFYRDIPMHYTWDTKTRTWNRRKNKNINEETGLKDDGIPDAIGRIYSIHPTMVELYSLRLLLNNVKGATSFEDINVYNGVQYDNHQEAAIARGLVKNDKMWIESIKEAAETETFIPRLRKLFATILVQCDVGNHKQFYDECKEHLYEDYLRQYKTQYDRRAKRGDVGVEFTDDWTLEDFANNSSLLHLERLLEEQNQSLDTFHLPLPDNEKEEEIQNLIMERLVATGEDELTPELAKEYFDANFPLLESNTDQLAAFDTIKKMILDDNRDDGRLIFLDAPGGTGKTFVLNVLISWIRMNNKEVAVSAATGVAANLLHLGRTSHSRYKMPIREDSLTCNVPRQSDLAKFLRSMDLGIIDEATMLDRLAYEALDNTLRDLAPKADKDKKFGGKLMLASGDFRQMLPVIPKASAAKTIGRTLKRSVKLWDTDVVVLHLRQNMRVEKEKRKNPGATSLHTQLDEFGDWLLDLGEGKLPCYPEEHPNSGLVEIPPSMWRDSADDVIAAVYEDFDDNVGNEDYFKSRMILAATNEIVNQVNNDVVTELPGELHSLRSVDTVGDSDDKTAFPTEWLNVLCPSGLPEHELLLKEEAIVILLRNMDIKGGHCNGTRYLVKRIGEYRLVLHKIGAHDRDPNKVLILPRIPMKKEDRDMPFTLTRLQFPVKLAFCLTINRAQGQSVDKCGILLPKNVWTHGQIYVAFSRCGNPNNVFVWVNQEPILGGEFKGKLPEGKKYVMNVVYKQIVNQG